MNTTINKTKEVSIDELWESAPISKEIFDPASIVEDSTTN